MDIFFDNEFRNLIPALQPDELEHLERSLKTEGNRDPIVVWKETQLLLDGHNRYDICTRLGIPLKPALEMSFPDRNTAMVWIIQNQFGRRNLSAYSRSVLALRLEEILRPKAIERMLEGKFICECGERFDKKVWHCPVCGFHHLIEKQQCNNCYHNRGEEVAVRKNPVPMLAQGKVREEVAKAAHVSHGTLDKVKLIEAKATPEQKEKLVNGNETINRVFMIVKRDERKEKSKRELDYAAAHPENVPIGDSSDYKTPGGWRMRQTIVGEMNGLPIIHTDCIDPSYKMLKDMQPDNYMAQFNIGQAVNILHSANCEVRKCLNKYPNDIENLWFVDSNWGIGTVIPGLSQGLSQIKLALDNFEKQFEKPFEYHQFKDLTENGEKSEGELKASGLILGDKVIKTNASLPRDGWSTWGYNELEDEQEKQVSNLYPQLQTIGVTA